MESIRHRSLSHHPRRGATTVLALAVLAAGMAVGWGASGLSLARRTDASDGGVPASLVPFPSPVPIGEAVGSSSMTAPVSGSGSAPPITWIAQALSAGPDATQAAAALALLRALGPPALTLIAQAQRQHPTLGTRPAWDRLGDLVAGQRDASASGLYWYTDLPTAEDAARLSGRPIVALRLLGKLTDEYSCANSRLFRALLYPDPQLRAVLHDQVICFWSSERAVPQVTIDLGDGRRLHTTLGGNSVHYLLDSDGQVLDALPGLYAPAAFLTQLRAGLQLYAAVRAHPARRAGLLADYHTDALGHRAQLARAHQVDPTALILHLDDPRILALDRFTRRADGSVSADPMAELSRVMDLGLKPDEANAEVPIALAERLTTSKSRIELPWLRAVGVTDPPLTSLLPTWTLASLASEYQKHLDPDGCSVLKRQLQGLAQLSSPSAAGAAPRQVPATGTSAQALSLTAAIAVCEHDLASDTVIDELVLHAAIHQHLLACPTDSLEQLNAWIYSTLFLTPRQEAWLGLIPSHFDGIDHHLE